MTPNQQFIVDQFQSETFIQGKMDVQHTPIYDTLSFTVGGGANPTINASTGQFFTNVGSSSGKTLAQCNMTQSQKLPAPQAFCIRSIRLRWSENILLADLLAIMNGFCLDFYLSEKYYQRLPLWMLNSGGGINGFTTRTSASVYTNGLPSMEAVRSLAIPIVIENQMSFFALLNGPALTLTTTATDAAATGAILTLALDGLYARGVQ